MLCVPWDSEAYCSMQRIASRWLLKRWSIPDICSKTKYVVGGDVQREVKVRVQSYHIAMVGRICRQCTLPPGYYSRELSSI